MSTIKGKRPQQADASRPRHEQVGRLVAELGSNVLIAAGEGDPRTRAQETSDAEVAVHTVEDAAGTVRVATELIAPGDVVFVKASSEYGPGACARELATY
ncbi:hypothetical protein [Streptomyces sp. TE33382]